MSAAPPRTEPPHPPPAGLIRGVGRWGMVALMINGIIGAGIFGLPSRVHALVGPWGLLVFVACALVVGGVALCTAEVASRFDATGGPYLYTRESLGPAPGFVIGWVMWLRSVTSLATVANVMASYVSFFWAPAAAGWGRAAAVSLIMAGLTAVNLAGVRRAASALAAFTIAKLAALLLFIGVGLFFVRAQSFGGAPLPGAAAFSRATFQLVFAFAGFEAMTVAAGETRDARRNVPFGLLAAIAVATVVYVLVQVVCIGTLPGLAHSEKPLAEAAVRFMGAAGGSVIALGALVSATGTQGGTLLAGSRMMFAMAERGELPRVLAGIDPRYRTPWLATLLTAGAGLALSMTGTFSYLVSLSVLTRLAVFICTAIALIVLRRRPGASPAELVLPGGVPLAILTCLACLWLVTGSSARELRDMGIATAAGLVVYAARRGGLSRA